MRKEQNLLNYKKEKNNLKKPDSKEIKKIRKNNK